MHNSMHIYPQLVWHFPAMIIGDETSLIKLRDAIDDAIKNNKSSTEVFASDGEGYIVYISKNDVDNLPLPYTDRLATDDSDEKQENLGTIMKSFRE